MAILYFKITKDEAKNTKEINLFCTNNYSNFTNLVLLFFLFQSNLSDHILSLYNNLAKLKATSYNWLVSIQFFNSSIVGFLKFMS